MRVVKKDGATMGEKIWARAAAILLALVLDALFIFFVTGLNPFSVYVVMFKGTFGTSIRFSEHFHPASDFPGTDTGIQDEILEYRRGGSGADGRTDDGAHHGLLGQ